MQNNSDYHPQTPGEFPFQQEIVEGKLKRDFSTEVEDEELKWHYDLKDRHVTILEAGGWQFQMDDGLPNKIHNGQEIWASCQYIGTKTNNQSEYSALILGLKEALTRDIKCLQVYGDSQLIINQINGEYKVRNPVS